MLNKKRIGKKLIKLRGNKKLSETAKDIGVTVSALRNYEGGLRIPRDEIKIRIAHYYDSSVENIFYLP